MPVYYDFDNMDPSNALVRTQYVLGYAIKLILVDYQAVTKTARVGRAEIHEIHKRLATTIADLIENDEEINSAPSQFEDKLKASASLMSSNAKDQDNMWKHALEYKRTSRIGMPRHCQPRKFPVVSLTPPIGHT
jgi:hypothetical protein